jgi:thiamine transport system permease protein
MASDRSVRFQSGLGLVGAFSALAAFVFWFFLVAVPLVMVVMRSIHAGDAGENGFFSPEILFLLRSTVFQASVSTLLSAAIGLPLGIFVGSGVGRFAFLSERLLVIPSGVPSVVAALSWVLILGRSGFLAQLGLRWDLLYSMKAVIIAHVFFNAPWIALLVAQARRSLPRKRIEAALSLGADRRAIVKWVLWPHLKWAFLSACVQTFSFCVMSFALVLLLGGGPSVQTLETALYSRIRYGALDVSAAVVCAVWELVLTLIPWGLVLYFQHRQKKLLERAPAIISAKKFEFSAWSVTSLCGFFLIPYFSIFSGFEGLKFFEVAGGELSPAFWVSVRLALMTASGALLMSVLALLGLRYLERWKMMEFWASLLLLLPAGVSALVLGLGLWLAYGPWVDPFAGSMSTWLAIILLQITLFFPITFRILWPLAQTLPQRHYEAAATLGCSSPKAFWLLDWPRWRGAVFSAFALVLAASLGEVASVSFFYHEDLIPMPLLISRWMSQYRFEDAQGVAAFLFSLSMVTIILVFRGARHEFRYESRHGG